MNCLVDWIGIYGCDAPTGAFSGVYINQLPGNFFKQLESIANPDQVTYLGVWNDIQTIGVKKFYNKVNSELQKKYRLKSLRSTLDLGNILGTENTTGTGQYRGFVYEMKLLNQYRRSNFQSLSVQKLKLYLLSAGSCTVKIADLDTGEVLFTSTFTGTVGWNTIQVNENFSSQRIFFGYDDTGRTAADLEINNSNSDWFNTMFASYYGNGCCNAYLNGAVTTDAAQIGVSQIEYTTGNNTFGLSGVFSLTCNYDFLICNNKDLFTTALLYCLGSEVMIYRQASDRLNKFTTIDAEKAAKLQEYFSQEFENELSIVLDGVRISTEDACIDCNTQIEILTATP